MGDNSNEAANGLFPVFAVTVDIAVFVVIAGELHVALIERGVEPFMGTWALPGGFKRPDETLEEAARRELQEESGLNFEALRQFGTFGDPGRDPRGNIVTVGFFAVSTEPPQLDAATDAVSAAYWPVRDVLAKTNFLAFDHWDILRSSLHHVRRELDSSDLLKDFLPSKFTIRSLQDIYEAVWDCKLDPSNLRRSLNLKTDDWLRSLEITTSSSKQGGRPSTMYEFSGDWSRGGPVRSPASIK